MPTLMAERIRLVLLIDDEVRAALRLEAAKRDSDMSQVAEAIFREQLADSLAEIKQRKQAESKRRKSDS